MLLFNLNNPAVMAQGVGIDVSTPNTKLDVNGDFALRIGEFIASNNNNHNINIGNKSFIRISGPNSSTYTITGIAGGVDGKYIILYNSTSRDMIIANQSTGSAASNRIICSDGVSPTIKPNGTATLIYSAVDSRWILVSVHKT